MLPLDEKFEINTRKRPPPPPEGRGGVLAQTKQCYIQSTEFFNCRVLNNEATIYKEFIQITITDIKNE